MIYFSYICIVKENTIIDLLNNPLESLEGYNGDYNTIRCDNKQNLLLKLERKSKLKNNINHEY